MNKRLNSIDTARGFSAFIVMLAHLEISPNLNFGFAMPIMLPLFFFISGYLFHLKKYTNFQSFFKGKILTLFFPWIVISYAKAYLNVSDIKLILHKPSHILDIFLTCSKDILLGHSVWFIPCLMVSFVICYGLIRLFREKDLYILPTSILLSVVSYYILPQNTICPWAINTAFISQFFIILGYVFHRFLDSHQYTIQQFSTWWTMILSIGIYGIVYYVLHSLDIFTSCNVRLSRYDNLYAFYLLALLGIGVSFMIACRFDHIPLFTFMGRNSLFYFAFGSHGYVVGIKVREYLLQLFHIETGIFSGLFVCLIACIFIMIPAAFADRFFPILNGKMPVFPDKKRKV